jgi:hypothetical protein
MGKALFAVNSSGDIGKVKIVTVYSPELSEPVVLPNRDLDFPSTAINRARNEYTTFLANRQYQSIPTDLNQSLILYDDIYQQREQATNTNLLILLQITMDGIQGTMNAYTLYTQNISLSLNNILLEKKIQDILSGKNEVKAMSDACGQFTASKTFVLAPLFSYYIMMYGLPAFGVGFDPVKLALILKILTANGIDPYA